MGNWPTGKRITDDLKERIKIAFASGSEDLIPTLIERMNALEPDLPLYVVSEFPPSEGRWRPYHLSRTFEENLATVRAAFADKEVVFAGLILQPNMPYWHMRLIPMRLWPLRTIFYNENLDHFMLRPQSLGTMARHFLWRARNFVRWQLRPGGLTYTFLWRLAHPLAFKRPLDYLRARRAKLKLVRKAVAVSVQPSQGVSVVIPSRNGKELLARLLPSLLPQMPEQGEVIVVDNGSDDGTAQSLPEGVLLEQSPEALSFAAAVNRGIARAQYRHVCLINNDMVLDPGFFTALLEAFGRVPRLFAATAQILFPEGVRREETGKAVMPPLKWRGAEDFPVRCDAPVEGEDLSYVLYGSGGCTLYDTAKLRALGAFDEAFSPAYVEDLDVGYRAWMQGWPTVFVSGAHVLHMHRSTTRRYFTEAELSLALERNYLRFAANSGNPRLWREAADRINLRAAKITPPPESLEVMAEAAALAKNARTARTVVEDMEPILALCSGAVAVFPGRAATGKKRVLVAAPYLPFPLSHGGAVRMYNLMRRASVDYDQVLITFADELVRPPRELLDICVEIVSVKRVGSHMRVSTGRPDVVEEFASPAFRAAIQMMVQKWKPVIAQLEFTQIAQYVADCAPAKTILVEHDVTLDLYAQLLQDREDWETRYQYERWVRFENEAWRKFDAVVAMSEKDRCSIVGARRAVTIMNGVDLERFQPSEQKPDNARLLFIGSFGHLPNIMALDFFMREVWPLLADLSPKLHVIAGRRYPYFLDHYRDRVTIDLSQSGIEVEDFVSDVRPAYRQAAIVIAPLVASAGTNIKIMEAMAMGKAIVSTPSGINGLELVNGRDAIVAIDGRSMANAIRELIVSPSKRLTLEREARATAERDYDWDVIAKEQKKLYESF